MKNKVKKINLNRMVKMIEANNEIFNNASDAEKRVIIAEDCIKRINYNQIIPESGVFVNDDKFNDFEASMSVKTILNTCSKDNMIQCQACGKGGLFLSYIGRVNDFKVAQINSDNDIADNEHRKLLEIFTAEQLALIEAAFEGMQMLSFDEKGNFITLSKYEDKDLKGFTSKYVDKYPDDTERLLAICQNIIDNKGTFVY